MAKTIVLHDFFEIRGGGERLAISLATGLGLDLCYGAWTKGSYPRTMVTGIRQFDLNAYSSLLGWKTLKIAHAFRNRTGFIANYDRAIYSGVCAPLAVCHRLGGDGLNLFYCHTPPRFIYDQKDYFLNSIPAWQRPLLHGLIRYLAPRYRAAVERMDLIVANSRNTQRRIRRFLRRESTVVYPPCDTARLRWLDQGDYYLSTARLDPLKRIDVIIEAFKRMPDKKLIVASGGAEAERLRKLAAAAGNIQFTGWLDEPELSRLLGHALATIYVPRDEDFGISPVESMAAGKPVIGVAEGGLLETVLHEETGLLLSPDLTPEHIIDAVGYLTPKRAGVMRGACEKRAQAFSTQRFLDQMSGLLSQSFSCLNLSSHG